MKQNSRFLFVSLALGLFLSCAQAPQQLVSEKPVALTVDLTSEKIRDSIVFIEGAKESGTGFFVSSDKIATNIHSVAHAGAVSVKSADEEKDWTIEGVVGFDAENGLVILKLTGEGTPLPLADSDRVEVGESVSILSYPDGAFKVLESRIQSLRKRNRWLRLNTTAAKKTNGSPVFNNNGQVIGVIVPYWGYAISVGTLEALLDASMPIEPLSEWQQREQIRAAAYYSLGKEKSKVEDYAGAIVEFDKAIKLNPKYLRAYYGRGRAQSELGDHDSATASLTQVLEMDPDKADAYYIRGSIKARRGDYAETIVDLNKAIELDAQYADAYSNRGGIKFLLGKSEEANGNAEKAQSLYEASIADCDKAIEIDPEYANTYNFRGSVKATLDDFEAAILDFNRAIEIDPEDADVYNNLGLAKLRLGESKIASGNAKEAKRLYKAAIKDITRSIQIDPEDAGPYNNRGAAKFSLGESKSARANVKKAKKAQRLYEAKVKKAQRLYEAAISDYTQAIKINPKYANAYENRATAKCELGDIESVRGDAEQSQRWYHDGITDYDKYIQLDNQDGIDAQTANLDSKIARNSTVLVLTWSGASNEFFSGSGFFVDKNQIVTNIHVVDLPGPVFVKRSDEGTIWAIEEIVAFDAENDLVVLKVRWEGMPLPLGDSGTVQKGEAIMAVGYPNQKYKITHGTIHSIRNSDKWIRMNIDTAGGSSGSPVLNSSGQVVGIDVSSVNLEGKSYALAIGSNTLKALLVSLESTEPLMEWRNRDHIRAYAHLAQGKEKLEVDGYDEAIAHFDKAIKLNPKNFDFYYERGHAKSAFDKHKAAIADFDKAIQINTEAIYIYFERADSNYTLGNYEMVIADFDKVIQLYPDHIGAYKKRAHAKFKLAESKAAQGDITGTLQFYQSAMEDCTQAIWLAPKDADAYDNRGWARFHLGKSEAARGNMKKAADLYEKAIEDYTQAIKINPEHPYAYRNRTNAKEALEKNEAARAGFEKPKELDPNVGK